VVDGHFFKISLGLLGTLTNSPIFSFLPFSESFSQSQYQTLYNSQDLSTIIMSDGTLRLCVHCKFQFSQLSKHLLFSPDCALPLKSAEGEPGGSLRPTSPPPGDISAECEPGDLFRLTSPSPKDISKVAATGESRSRPTYSFDPVTGTSTYDDLDEDDLAALFLTESQQQQRTIVGLPPPPTSTHRVTHPPIAHSDPCVPSLQSGEVCLVPPNYGKGKHCFTQQDRSMMKLYNICDQAGSPRYLMDKVLHQLKHEVSSNGFDFAFLTKRDPFMARMHRKFPSPPPEAISIQLESFDEPITMYRFNAIDQLQLHLLRKDLYGDLTKLNVNQSRPFDQSQPVASSHMREITDGTWHAAAVSEYILGISGACHDDLDDLAVEELDQLAVEKKYTKFLLTLEEYKDSTGSDQKEAFSLEPILMATGLLDASFNGDPSSRFILGYIPSLSNMKSSAAQSRLSQTLAGYGASVRDYHKCLSIILQP
jgi:hypothetical protein